MEKEYYTVADVNRKTNLSSKQIRNRILRFRKDGEYNNMISKDSQGRWVIHRMILSRFKPERIRESKFYALTIDPVDCYSEKDLMSIMKFVVDDIPVKQIQISYTIEKKKSNGLNHIHLFTNCEKRKTLIQTLRIAFSKMSYKESNIFDSEGWESYIQKDGCQIIRLNK